jgi:uncharacterized protein YdgA (DUF945 family)
MENMFIVAEGRVGTSKLGVGTATLGIDKFRFSGAPKDAQFELSKLVYAADVKESGQFIDIHAAYRIGGLAFGAEQKKYGPMVLETGFDHLHAPTLLAMSDSLNRFMCAKPDQKEAMTAETMSQWKKLAIALLENKPVFQLKQMKFAAPDGELEFKGKIGVDGFKAAMLYDMRTAMAALPDIMHIEFAGQASEKMLMSSFTDVATGQMKQQMLLSGTGDMPPEQLKTLQENAEHAARMQLDLAIAQNFIKQEGDWLTFSFSFNKGQAVLNGAPLDLPFLQSNKAAPVASIPAAPTLARTVAQ